MFENIPHDLLERFNKYHEKAKILDFKIKEDDCFKTETIYYEYFNVLGALKKTTFLNNGHIYINDNSLLAGDIQVFLEKAYGLGNSL
ncbi:hypothetical protein [Clostridium saudiense]|jgi:hypothetical protein|uniref:hypothetical protein n=1 Tax=Clostridium saudiense TaxID=1414720 RepID=UPI0004BB3755|nr:hypothetical protein [Clostridium saudiense]SCJ53698.1 Uncharacterised protein [uncultured Clostridium sp.]